MFMTISKKSKSRREVPDTRRAGTEIVRILQRGCEHRATAKFTLSFVF